MKKITFILLIMLFFAANVFSASITGNWLAVKIDDGKKITEPYFTFNLNTDGKFSVMQIPFGNWKISKDKKILTLSSKFDKDFNGDIKILKLTDTDLVLEKDNIVYYYKNINEQKISKTNSSAPILGTWTFKEDYMTHTIKFEKPDHFLAVSTGDGSTTRISGNWIYNKNENSIITISFFRELKGKNIIKKITKDELIIENKGKIFKLKKEKLNKVERLNFTYDDFSEQDISEENLPWNDFYKMVDYLSGIKEIHYKRSYLIPETNTFKISTIKSEITANKQKQSVKFRNIYIENDIEEQFSEKYKDSLSERYNYFFPKDTPHPYKILGTQTVIVPAGTFDCTVVEGFDDEDKIKYWLINDKPGIYAKIIIDGKSLLGDLKYIIMELKDIR
jgi:hypothetical protein